jgi:imidazole glycerol phosphate synthase subunit HisF
MTEKASKISCDVPELKCDYSRTETMDMGLKALMATGMVPAGYEFKTNSTPASKASKTTTHTTESLVEDYQASGYDVVVLEGMSFDKDGRNYGYDAIVVKKREETSA